MSIWTYGNTPPPERSWDDDNEMAQNLEHQFSAHLQEIDAFDASNLCFVSILKMPEEERLRLARLDSAFKLALVDFTELLYLSDYWQSTRPLEVSL